MVNEVHLVADQINNNYSSGMILQNYVLNTMIMRHQKMSYQK